MRLKEKNLRRLISEVLDQHLRGNLDPRAGQMAALEASDPHKDYMMWAKTNGQHPASTSVLASYANEKGLAADSLEIQQISNKLSLGFDSSSEVRTHMKTIESNNALDN